MKRKETNIMQKNIYRVEDKGIIKGLPTAKVEGSNGGRFQKLHRFDVYDEEGNLLLSTAEFTKKQDTTYFLRESCKKDAFLLGVCEIAEGLKASGYRYNQIFTIEGKKYFRMSAYLYRWEGNRLLRWTYDEGAAFGRIDEGTEVATRNGNVITLKKKTATSRFSKKVNNPSTVRTDTGKVHEEDNTPRGALEKVRRTPKRS